MPLLPSRQGMQYNAPLTNVSVAYLQDQSEFCAAKVFPTVKVAKQAGRYTVWPKESYFSTQAQKRAPASESAGIVYELEDTFTYFCDEWSVHIDVAEETYISEPDYYKIDERSTLRVARHVALRQEQLFVHNYMREGVWAGTGGGDYRVNTDGNGYWDSATSDPASDIAKQKLLIKRKTGFEPNTLVLGDSVKSSLRNHPRVRDVFKYVQAAILDDSALARLFGVERIFVPGAVIDQNPLVGGESNLNFMTDNDVLLCYAAPEAGIDVPSAGYTFDWVNMPGANGDTGVRISKMDVPLRHATRIEATGAFEQRIVGADLGIFSPNVLEKPL